MISNLEKCGESAFKKTISVRLFQNPKILKRTTFPSILIYTVYVLSLCSVQWYMSNNVQDAAFLTNLGKKAVRCSTQLDFLKNSVFQSTVPSGIAVQMKFVPSIQDDSLKSECNSIMEHAGSRILDVMVNFYSRNSSILRSDFYAKSEHVKTKLTDEEFTTLMIKVKNKMHNEKIECIKRHTSKLCRDKTINHVYVQRSDSILHSATNNVFSARKRRRKTKNFRRPWRKCRTKLRRSRVKGDLPRIIDMNEGNMKRTVVNLTPYQLTPAQLYIIFYLSHSFAPMPTLPNLSVFEQDLEKWTSKLRYKLHFHIQEGNKLEKQPLELFQLKKKMSTTVIPRFTGPRFTVSLDILCLIMFPQYRVLHQNLC